MAKRRRLIPFTLVNKLLGLTGDEFVIANLKYYYHGPELKVKLEENRKKTPEELELAQLARQFKNNELTATQYEKQKATILKEPWYNISVIPSIKNPLTGYLEMDYNKYMITELNKIEVIGKQNITDEEKIDIYMTKLINNIAQDEDIFNK